MKISKHRVVKGTTLAAAIVLSITVAGCSSAGKSNTSDKYPNKKITLTVQAEAGGGSDLAARAIAKDMKKSLDQNIVVENRPGASGSKAIKYVAGQKADGYHIGFAPIEIAMFKHLGIDVAPNDIGYLGEIMTQPGTIAVPKGSPYKSLKDLMKAAKDKKLSVSNSGSGSSWEAATKLLGKKGHVKFKPVPFDGGGPAVTAAEGKKVDAVVAGAGETHKGVKNDKLRVLAVFRDKPHPQFPKIPTAKSEGYDVDFGAWGGLYAPKGLPDEVKKKLEKATKQGATSEKFKKTIKPTGTIPVYKNGNAFEKYVNEQYKELGKVLNE